MKVWRGDPLTWGPPPPTGSAVSIGVFDGVHRGHQAVLADVAQRAGEMGGLERVVLTFDQHPRAVVDPAGSPPLLTSLDERLDLLDELGIELAGVLPFEQIRDTSPEAFVSTPGRSMVSKSMLSTSARLPVGPFLLPPSVSWSRPATW